MKQTPQGESAFWRQGPRSVYAELSVLALFTRQEYSRIKRPVIIYRYLPSEFALLAIQQQRLKVGRLNELNDIFDSHPTVVPPRGLSQADARTFVESMLDTIANDGGVICYCGNADNLLVWSHYGMAHKGIALGFECPCERPVILGQIEYPKNNQRPTIDLSGLHLPIDESVDWEKARACIARSLFKRAGIGRMRKSIVKLSS